MFGNLFKKKQPEPSRQFLVAQLNARLRPEDRGEIFEDHLETVLKEGGHGEITGGGSMLRENGEVKFCDIEIEVPVTSPEVIALVVSTLEKLGAPKGSILTVDATGEETPFGTLEGLAVYLNGTDLPAETYEEGDPNYVYSEFQRLLEGEGRVMSYWQGPRETALYMYGGSFSEMKDRLSDFLATYPLCAKCRVEQIA